MLSFFSPMPFRSLKNVCGSEKLAGFTHSSTLGSRTPCGPPAASNASPPAAAMRAPRWRKKGEAAARVTHSGAARARSPPPHAAVACRSGLKLGNCARNRRFVGAPSAPTVLRPVIKAGGAGTRAAHTLAPVAADTFTGAQLSGPTAAPPDTHAASPGAAAMVSPASRASRSTVAPSTCSPARSTTAAGPPPGARASRVAATPRATVAKGAPSLPAAASLPPGAT